MKESKMNFHTIDVDSWSRKPYFDHYMNTVRCTYSMTANLDVTGFLDLIREKGLKLYCVMIHMISKAVNNHQEFRMDYDDQGKVGYYDVVHPQYTIFHKDTETFSFVYTPYQEELGAFAKAYDQTISRYGSVLEMAPQKDIPDNTFSISCIPWVNFTGFQLNIYEDGTYLLPIFTIGKYFEQNGVWLLPLSVQVHHSVCDGFHTSRLFQDLQEQIDLFSHTQRI